MEICIDDYTDFSSVAAKAKSFEKLSPAERQRQKSFYGKASIFMMPNGDEVLVSYITPVAMWFKDTGLITKLQKNDRYTTSQTTMRHINAFLDRHGDTKGVGAREWRKMTGILVNS